MTDKIPQQLKRDEFRFTPIKKGKKTPYMTSWQKTNNFQWTDEPIKKAVNNGGNYGVVCGYDDLAAIDSDAKEVEEEADKQLPETFKVRTGGGGSHKYYYCPDLEKTIPLKNSDGENVGHIKGPRSVLVGPGSIHPNGNEYEVVNNERIKEVSASELKFALRKWIKDETSGAKSHKTVDENGLSIESVVDLSDLKQSGDEYYGEHPIHGSSTGRNFWVNPEKNAWRCFRHDNGGGPLMWLAVKYEVIDCAEAESGALQGEKFVEVIERADREGILDAGDYLDNEEKNQETIETSKVESENFLAEEIIKDGRSAFAYLENGQVKIKEKIDTGDVVYVPKNDDAIKSEAVLLPSGIEDYETTKKLTEEIQDLIHKYVDVTEKFEKLASWYVVMTWVYDKLNVLSYLRALGDTGTGKSRLLNVAGKMCYKPITISGSVTPAPIYRLLEQWKGTLVIDEGDLKKSDATNEIVTILNCGYERGRPVMRCVKDNPDEIHFHRTFGPKIIATRQEFNDKALESRCLTEKMKQTGREDIPDQLPDEFFEKAEDIRNKLLKWRLENKAKIDVAKSQDIKIGNIEPRLKQVTRCYLAVFNDPEIHNDLFELLEEHQKEIIEQRAQTWEGMIVNVIHGLDGEDKEKLDGRPKITPKKISEKIIDEYGEDRVKPPTVGKILRGLDLETKRKRFTPEDKDEKVQRRVLIWDDETLETLYERYVPDYADFVTGGTDVTVVTGDYGGDANLNNNRSGSQEEENTTGQGHPSRVSHPSQLSQSELKDKLADLLYKERPKVSELQYHFDPEDLPRVNEMLQSWKEGGKAEIGENREWRLIS